MLYACVCVCAADYECDFEGEYFSCEIGDFSSKFGFIEIGQEATYDAWDLPPLMKLMVRLMLMLMLCSVSFISYLGLSMFDAYMVGGS